jgi:hypothetical protein
LLSGPEAEEEALHAATHSLLPLSLHSNLHAAPPARKALTMEEAREAFEQVDKNNDGNLSQIEFIKALRSNPELAKRLGDVSSVECVLSSIECVL